MLLAYEVDEVRNWRAVLPTVLAWLLLALVLLAAVGVYRVVVLDAYLANGYVTV